MGIEFIRGMIKSCSSMRAQICFLSLWTPALSNQGFIRDGIFLDLQIDAYITDFVSWENHWDGTCGELQVELANTTAVSVHLPLATSGVGYLLLELKWLFVYFWQNSFM